MMMMMMMMMVMVMMEIDALPFKILFFSSSYVLVKMVMEAALETAAAEQQGSAPRAWMNDVPPSAPPLLK
jgi:hypothetical protein